MQIRWILVMALLCFVVFCFAYRRNKMSIIPAYFLSTVLSLLVIAVMSQLYVAMIYSGSLVVRIIFMLFFIPLVFVVLFGIYALIAILLMNTYTMFQKERRSLAHALTFVLALCFIVFLIVTNFVQRVEIPDYIQIFIYAGYFLVAFYFAHIVHYTLASILCNLAGPKYNQQYIIVHGSGLIDGKVSPLLAGRVERAVRFYHKQKEVWVAPKIICSGGQGADEPISEAQAMMEYALSKGVLREDILLEDKSSTTLQNMKFSKEIMDKQTLAEDMPYRAVFATSNYHLLRTGMYARKVGLCIDGIGSKTALYYLPNALIREYIAYVMMHKKWHMLLFAGVFFASVLLMIILLVNR